MNAFSGRSTPGGVFASQKGSQHPNRGFHVSGRNKRIREIDLSLVFGDRPSSSIRRRSGPKIGPQADEEIQIMLQLITSLDLSRNEIEHLNNLYTLGSLRELDVSYNFINRITRLPETLTCVDLSHNKLRTLEGISSLVHLRDLNVSSNRLTNFIGLSSRLPLQVLKADDNRIVTTTGLEEMPHLRLLSVSNNFIEGVSQLSFLRRAVALESLNLKKNPIAHLNGYRQLVVQRQPALLTLDEEPVLHHSERGSSSEQESIPVPEVAPLAVPTEPISRTARAKITQKKPISFLKTAVKPCDALSCNLSPRNNKASIQEGKNQQGEGCLVAPKHRQLPRSVKAAPRHAGVAHNPVSVTSSHPAKVIVSDSKFDPLEDTSETEVDDVEVQLLETLPSSVSPNNSYTTQFLSAKGLQSSSAQSKSAVAALSSPPSSRKSYTIAKASPKGGPSLLTRHEHHRDGRDDESRSRSSVSKVSSPNNPGLSLTPGTDSVPDHKTVALLHDSLVVQEQLKRENQMLRVKLRSTEDQLSDSRRVISEQLTKLSNGRIEINALRNTEAELKEQLERLKRHSKALESHHKDEIKTLQTQYERTKAFYEAQIADLQQQVALHSTRSGRDLDNSTSAKHQDDWTMPLTKSLPVSVRSKMVNVGNLAASELSSNSQESQELGQQCLVETPLNSKNCISSSEQTVLKCVVASPNLTEQLKRWLVQELTEATSTAESELFSDKLINSLKVAKQEQVQKIEKEESGPTFAEDTQALLEAAVLSRQYTIQNHPEPDCSVLEAANNQTLELSSLPPNELSSVHEDKEEVIVEGVECAIP